MSYPAIPARVATSRTTGRGGHTRPALKPTSATPQADSATATPTHSRRRRLSHHSQSKHDKSSHSARASHRHSVTKSTTTAEHARTTVKGSPTWTTHGVTGPAAHPTRNTTTTTADAAAATSKDESHEEAKQQQQQSVTNAQTVTRSEKITLPLSVLVLSNRFAVHHPYSLKALGEASQTTQVNTRDKAQRVAGATTLSNATAPLHESGNGLQERSAAQEPSHAESASYVENNNNSNTVNAMPAGAFAIDDEDDAAHEPQPRQVHIVPQKHALLTSQAMPSAASHDNLSAAPSYGLVSAINEANSTDCAVATMNANPRPMLLSAGSLARPSPTPRRTSLPREQANHMITVDETKKKSKGRSASRVPSLSSASRTSPPRLLAPPTTLSETTQFIQRMDYELALLERRHLEQRALHGLPEPRRSRSRRAHSQQQQQQQHSHLNPVQTARSGRSAGSTSGRLRRRQDSTQRPSTARTPAHEVPTANKLRRSDAAPHIVIGTAEQTASKGTRRHLCAPALSGRRTTASTSSRRSTSSQQQQQQHSPSTPPRQTMSYTMLAHTAQAPLGKGSLTANNGDTTAAGGNVSHHLLLHHHRRPLLPSHKASMNSPNKQSGSATTNERHRVERTATAKPSCVAAGEVACHGPPPVSDDDEEDDDDEDDEVVVETGSAVREASPMTKVSTATAASEIASATHNGVDEVGVTHDGGVGNAMSGNGAAIVMNEEDAAAAALRTPPHKALSEENSETNTMPYRGSTGRRPERMLEEDMEEVHQDIQAHVALEEYK